MPEVVSRKMPQHSGPIKRPIMVLYFVHIIYLEVFVTFLFICYAKCIKNSTFSVCIVYFTYGPVALCLH